MSKIGRNLCGSSDTTFLLKQRHLKAQDYEQVILELSSSIILPARKTQPPLWAVWFTMLSHVLSCMKCVWPWYRQPKDVQAQFCTLHLGKVLGCRITICMISCCILLRGHDLFFSLFCWENSCLMSVTVEVGGLFIYLLFTYFYL